ncbi:MAG: DUF1566 domain-containing protein [Myxococcota bacterium]|nr:DUF1566 domain-containing protein [Myxococcota bacterium]
MPNASSLALPNPQSYDTSSVGTVLDRVTGLVWQQAVDPGTYNWSASGAYCQALALGGHHDWRLPSMIELVSIVDLSQAEPAIRGDAFPSTPSSPFWSAQLDVTNSGLGWYVYFKNGGAYGGNDVVDPQRVRCVRSPAAHTASSYLVADATVYDPNTKLTWQRTVEPSSYAWTDAQSRCATVPPLGSWRLPSLNELMTLVDLTRFDPAVDATAFPSTPIDFFWSLSVSVAPVGTAWGVNFNRGSAGASLTANASRVRCVR